LELNFYLNSVSRYHGLVNMDIELEVKKRSHLRVRAEIPKPNSRREGGKFLSLSEACEMVEVKPTTYRRYEGSLFPKARRLNNHFRIFTFP
jgi:hypothetical protein